MGYSDGAILTPDKAVAREYDRSGISVGLVSLGCPKNQVDSEAMLGLLTERGYGLTPYPTLAHIIIVNTCGFIDSAKSESISAILDMAGMKADGRCKGLVVTGCLSERFKDMFASELPEVDAALGVRDYHRICDVVDALAFGNGWTRSANVNPADERLLHLGAPRILTDSGAYVYIKIAEGCDNRCTYCVIPAIRGGYASRPAEEIIAETRALAKDRDIEAVLVAQDTTRYGAEFSGAAGGPPAPLLSLIDGLSRIERVRWIRLLYTYPELVDDRLTGALAENEKLLPYLDLPIQHASDTVLKRMGRRYTGRELSELITKLRLRVPGIVLRTTLITGFPGETDGDFDRLMAFVAESRFERLGVFAYSREEGTAAARMDGQVPKKLARARRSALLRAQAAIMAGADRARVGREYEAVIDAGPEAVRPANSRSANARAPQIYLARTYAEAPKIDGHVRVAFGGAARETDGLGGAPRPGDFVRVRVTGADSRGPYGEIINEPTQ